MGQGTDIARRAYVKLEAGLGRPQKSSWGPSTKKEVTSVRQPLFLGPPLRLSPTA